MDAIPGALVGRRFDVDLIDSRRQALEAFLNRCLLHPRIGHSSVLHSFLRDCEDWIEYQQCYVGQVMLLICLRTACSEVAVMFLHVITLGKQVNGYGKHTWKR